MNIILIVSDTCRMDYLSCYGNKWISTPNIEKLAKMSLVFDKAYTASFPTVPNRTDLITGRYTFTYHDWEPLAPQETILSETLGEAGYTSMFIADTPHIMSDGRNYDRGYSGWMWIRGQENDRLMTDPVGIKLPCPVSKIRRTERSLTESALIQHMRNTAFNRHEEDTFVAKTMQEACRWLERNYKRDKFFLYLDTFDPHEPWDPPHYFVDMYDKDYKGPEILYPHYGPYKGVYTEREIKHLRASYAGELTLMDRWVGRVLQKIEDLGLFSNTLVIFTTDHGFYIGEHGLTGKTSLTKKFHRMVPLYEELAHIPLIMYFPKTRPGRIKAFVQPPDIMPTILDFAGVKIPPTVQGKSVIPLIKNRNAATKDFSVSTPSIQWGPGGGRRVTITTRDWALIYKGRDVEASGDVEIKIVDGVLRKQEEVREKLSNELYDLKKDPRQQNNVIDKNRNIAVSLHRKFVEFLKSIGSKEEQLRYWDRL